MSAGTGTRAQVAGFDLAGKTGTTSDYRDAWFVGYTGGFTAAVWVGKDDNKPMGKVTGGTAPAQIWKDFMKVALPRLQVKAIPDGPADVPVFNDPIGDLLADVGDVFGDIMPVETAPYAPDTGNIPLGPGPAPTQPVGPPTANEQLTAETQAALDELFEATR